MNITRLRGIATLSKKSIAVACPGQGIIEGGLLIPFLKYRPIYNQILEEIDETLQENFSENLFNPSVYFAQDWLKNTANAQPAILSTTYIITEILRIAYGVDFANNENVKYFMGHSLGEYSALLVTGVLDLRTAIQLVRKRARLMQDLIGQNQYEMASLIFKKDRYEGILNACKEANTLANINGYQQIAVSGTACEIENLMKRLERLHLDISRKVKLPVNIPFHNHILSSIEQQLLDFTPTAKQPSKPIISNLTAVETQSPFELTIAANSRPVKWLQSIEYAIGNGTETFVTLGPGTVLANMNKRFKAQHFAITDGDRLENFVHRFEKL